MENATIGLALIIGIPILLFVLMQAPKDFKRKG